MKKLLAFAIITACAASLTLSAAEGGEKKKGPPMTQEQKDLRKKMTEKYDANKDGKLDKDEIGKFSAEDKEAWSKAFPKKEKK